MTSATQKTKADRLDALLRDRGVEPAEGEALAVVRRCADAIRRTGSGPRGARSLNERDLTAAADAVAARRQADRVRLAAWDGPADTPIAPADAAALAARLVDLALADPSDGDGRNADRLRAVSRLCHAAAAAGRDGHAPLPSAGIDLARRAAGAEPARQ